MRIIIARSVQGGGGGGAGPRMGWGGSGGRAREPGGRHAWAGRSCPRSVCFSETVMYPAWLKMPLARRTPIRSPRNNSLVCDVERTSCRSTWASTSRRVASGPAKRIGTARAGGHATTTRGRVHSERSHKKDVHQPIRVRSATEKLWQRLLVGARGALADGGQPQPAVSQDRLGQLPPQVIH